MSELFSIYEESLKMVIDKAKSQFEKSSKSEADLNSIKVNITEAERIVKQMELEMTTSSKTIDKPKLLSVKFRNYGNEVEALKKKFLALQERYINKRQAESLSFDSGNSSFNLKDQRKNLIEMEDSWDGSEAISQMKRETYRIEDMGNNIARDMNDQSEQMKHIKIDLFDIEKNVDQSTSLIKKMLMRENRTKLILGIVAIIAGMCILSFLVYNLIRN